MNQDCGNAIEIGGKEQKSFFRYKYLSIDDVMVYTGLGQLTSDLLQKSSIMPVLIKGKEKYLKSDIDKMMFKYAS